MSKARKRHRQPWWKRSHTVRRRFKDWHRRVASGEIRIVDLTARMRALYPLHVDAPAYHEHPLYKLLRGHTETDG